MDALSKSFPDPRKDCEITIKQILSASMAGHFQDISIAFGAINVHDLTLCRDMIMTTEHLKPGDMLIEDCGFLDGDTISRLKKERKVDVILPLRSDMKAYADSLTTAYHPDSGTWESHPTREKQQIKRVERVDWMWDECEVEMDGCVVRELKKNRDGAGGQNDYEHWVFATQSGSGHLPCDMCPSVIQSV